MGAFYGEEGRHKLIVCKGLGLILRGLGFLELIPPSLDETLEEVRISLRWF